jgi:hypothetical protein
VKLKYRDFVGDHIKDATERILAIRPAPLIDVSHRIVINTRRMNARITDFLEARKVLTKSYSKEVMQFKTVLFFVPEAVDINIATGIARDKVRLHKALANQEEREDGIEILSLDWMPVEQLEEVLATDVFDLMDFESMNTPTKPVLIDGMWNFVVIQHNMKREWVFRKDSERFQKDMDELWDTEVDVEIRPITESMIKKSEEKRPGFVIPPDDMLTIWFMFELDKE